MDLTQWNRYLYAGWAPFYDLLVGSLEEKRKRSLELAAVKPGEKVLLLGAGTGLDIPYLPKDAEITAIDITPEMISRLRRRAHRLNMNIDARVMDGQKLDFASDTFDVVILHFVLAVIPDPLRAIREAERVLRPGGRIIVLNKFLKDESQPSPLLRLANKVARVLITDITCKLKPLVSVTNLHTVHQETIGLGGFFKIAILTKDTSMATARVPAPHRDPQPTYEPVPTPSRITQPALTLAPSQTGVAVAQAPPEPSTA